MTKAEALDALLGAATDMVAVWCMADDDPEFSREARPRVEAAFLDRWRDYLVAPADPV